MALLALRIVFLPICKKLEGQHLYGLNNAGDVGNKKAYFAEYYAYIDLNETTWGKRGMDASLPFGATGRTRLPSRHKKFAILAGSLIAIYVSIDDYKAEK